MRYLYNSLFYLALPFIFLRLWLRSRQSPAYKQRWAERLGFIKNIHHNESIWLHAVSFGEAKVAIPLVQALQKKYPKMPFIVTSMTVTGSQQIQAALGKSVLHFYIPYDYPGAVKRFLKRAKPKALIIMETELWPNILHYCEKAQIPIIIANARLAEKSFKGYQQARFLLQPLLKKIALVLAQTQTDAQRYTQLGVPATHAIVTNNIKFDITPPKAAIADGNYLRQRIGKNRPVWIAASTHSNEEEIILQAFAKIRSTEPNAFLILVPRHPERFDEIAKLCLQYHYKITRRNEDSATKNLADSDIYLGDSMGELWLFYAASDIAFVGGSLISQGGHNILEPAALSLPVITGPYLFHFQQIADFFLQQHALTIIHNEDELANTVLQFFQNLALRTEQGKRGQQVVLQNQGALQNHLQRVEKIIVPRNSSLDSG